MGFKIPSGSSSNSLISLSLPFQWNNHGYDVAKTFGPKFDMISPVWLQILRKGDMQYELMGTHDVDRAWMKNVRSRNEKTKSESIY